MNNLTTTPAPAIVEPIADKSYRVHLYAVVRVPYEITGASSAMEAIDKAEEMANLESDFRKGEYADEVTHVLVDERVNGDVDDQSSCFFVPDVKTGGWVPEASETPAKPRILVVDGCDEQGLFSGDGKNAPFVVFDVDQQENIAGPFITRELGEDHRQHILRGGQPVLNEDMLVKLLS